MTAASLSLLKGATPVDEEDQAAEASAITENEDGEVSVEVDQMDSDALDNLVEEYEIEVPAEWSGWEAEDKRGWLKSQFDEEGEEAPAEEAKPEPEPEEKKPAAKKSTSKAKAKPAEEPKAEEPAPTPEPEPEAEKAEEKPAAKKAPAKSKTKGTAVAKAKAPAEAEVQQAGDDVLADLIHTVETMKEHTAHQMVHDLAEEAEVTFIRLGGALSVIQANGWYAPYASFRDYVEKQHGLHYRKATYWTGIYNALAESKVPWSKVADLGWTKLKEIAAIINNDNVDEWVQIAKTTNTLSLIEAVKNHQSAGTPKALEDQTSKTVTTKTFKVHDDQKVTIEAAIAKAKADTGTTVDTVALEHICMDYSAGMTMVERLKTMGIEKALEAVEKAFPTAEIAVTLNE